MSHELRLTAENTGNHTIAGTIVQTNIQDQSVEQKGRKSQRSATMSVPMYLRVKRYNQTYFVMCQSNDTFAFVKEQIALANPECLANHMRLILPKENIVLQDDDKLEKYGEDIKNETELYVVFKISDEEWESVAITETQAAFGGDGP